MDVAGASHTNSALALNDAKLIAKGFTSEVYAWGGDSVLKLFHSWVPRYRGQREYNVTRAVNAAGIPAPVARDLIEVEGRPGIVFQRIEGVSMLRRVQARPWTLFAAVRRMAELHAQMHRYVAPSGLPSQRAWIGDGIDRSAVLADLQKEEARRVLADLPEGTALCHGDFHPENILFTAQGPMVIDWETATRGHPLADVACTSRLIETASLPSWTPMYMHLLLKISRTLLHRNYLKHYFRLNPGAVNEIRMWKTPLAAAATSWRIPNSSL